MTIATNIITNTITNTTTITTPTITTITTPHPAAKRPAQPPQPTATTPPLDRETTGRVSVASDDENRSERRQTRRSGLGMFFYFFYCVF
jgi:hypothetical protein